MLRLSANIYYGDEEEGTIIVDVSRGKFFELNQVSQEIIKLVTQNKTEEEISDLLSMKYNVDAKRISNDVKIFIEKSMQMGILEVY